MDDVSPELVALRFTGSHVLQGFALMEILVERQFRAVGVPSYADEVPFCLYKTLDACHAVT